MDALSFRFFKRKALANAMKRRYLTFASIAIVESSGTWRLQWLGLLLEIATAIVSSFFSFLCPLNRSVDDLLY